MRADFSEGVDTEDITLTFEGEDNIPTLCVAVLYDVDGDKKIGSMDLSKHLHNVDGKFEWCA